MSLELAVVPPSRHQHSGLCSVTMEEFSPLGDDGRSTDSPKRKHLTSFSTGDFLTNKKRGNHQRTLLPCGPNEVQRDGEGVEVEGLLVVAEQVERGQTPQKSPVFRTLGSVDCVLVRKNAGLFLETVSTEKHPALVLNMNTMDLVHEPFENDCKFQLRRRQSKLGADSSGQRAESYVFMTSTKDEYVQWLHGIRSHQVSATGKEPASLVSEPMRRSRLIGSTPVRPSADSNAQCEDQQQRRQTEGRHAQPQPSLGKFLYSTPPRTKHFIMVRHGHYINAHMPQVSDSHQVLSQMGRQQAELTGKYLGVAHYRIPTRHDVCIYHSDMTRAVETAAIIATDFGEISLNSSSLLREGWPGTPYSTDFTVKGGTSAAARNHGAFEAMQEQTCVDVERMEKAFSWFLSDSRKTHDDNDEESYCVLVCHANLIRFFLCRALGVDPATTWGHFEINHCGVTRIDVCANRPIKVIAVNETGHLPLSLITSSEDHL